MYRCCVIKKAAKTALCIVLSLMITACGKNNASGTTADGAGGNNAFNEAISEIKQDDKLGKHTGAAKEKLGGISFTIIDSSTIKASINDPAILAKATDMSQVLLRLFPDESARDRTEGAFAFKMCFYGQDDGSVTCNVYPQICRVDKVSEYCVQTYEESIPRPDGGDLCGAATVEDTMITFVVQYSGLSDIVRDNPYYAAYVDYEEYSKGKILSVNEPKKIVPDLSQTSLKDAVKYTYFLDVFPEYFVIEEDYDAYKSYSGHKFVHSINEYRQNAIELLWTPTSNSDISKKSVLIGSVDEFGVANYNMAVVYESHDDLIRDYMGDEAVNLSLAFGVDDPNPDLITDEVLYRFVPENSGNIWGTWSYSVDDNVLYWHYIPEFDEHYKSYDGFSIPRIEFTNAGINGGPGELNTRLDEIVHEVIETGKAEGKYEYTYQWDDMTQSATNSFNATASVSYKGYYHKPEPTGDSSDNGATLSQDDNAKILEETLRIRDEIIQAKEADLEAKKNASKTVDPSADCYMYDDDSTDFLLKDLDTDALASGGAYEIEFDGYTIRLTATSIDDPHCEIGKYNGDSFEKICDTSCYRNLDAGPNHVTINANISAIDGVDWTKVDSIELYELKDGKTRTKINNPITINRWYQ